MGNKINVKYGRDNLSLTVFVPWDCSKECSFCTTKRMYGDNTASLDEIIDKMTRTLDKFKDIQEVVISGGEPLADMEKLSKIIESIPFMVKVYINTSMPILDSDGLRILRSLNYRINGFNVSRHLGHNYKGFYDFDQMRDIVYRPNIRINILLSQQLGLYNEFSRKMNDYILDIMQYSFFDIQLRADYNKTTRAVSKVKSEFILEDEQDATSEFLLKNTIFKSERSGCSVCRTLSLRYNIRGNKISYHKGLPSTLVKRGPYVEVNDVIIFPDGTIRLDWNGESVDLEDITFTKPTPLSKKFKACGVKTSFC